jgi:hypothetical protein
VPADIVIVVPHPSRQAVLTTEDGALPATTSSGSSTTDHLEAVTARLGTLPPVLRIVVGPLEADGESGPRLIDLDTIGPNAPAGFVWTDTDALDVVGAAPPQLHEAVRHAIGRHRAGPGRLDPPWSRPGWFARASTWMTDRMTELGPAATGPPRVVYLWGVSMVLRADSAAGPIYLKCSAPIFDWTDAAISHPFTDLAVYVTRADAVALRRAMRDAYLARWADRLEPAALVEAGDLAIIVGTLYQVDSYLRILESLDPDDVWDLAHALGSWARSAVATLSERIDLVRPGHADG